MDRVILKDISVYAYHGVLAEERERGQEFLITVEFYSNFQGISCTDDLNEVMDYSIVLEEIITTATQIKYRLLETLAERLALNLLEFDKIDRVKVTVEKPRPPLPAITGGVQVSLERE